MAPVEFAPAAVADLTEIVEYIAVDNRVAAAKLIARFKELAESLAGSPSIGRARKDLQANLRSFPVGRYVLFFDPWRAASRWSGCSTACGTSTGSSRQGRGHNRKAFTDVPSPTSTPSRPGPSQLGDRSARRFRPPHAAAAAKPARATGHHVGGVAPLR